MSKAKTSELLIHDVYNGANCPEASIIGQKAYSLFTIPVKWRLPILVLKADRYHDWVQAKSVKSKADILAKAASAIYTAAQPWDQEWKNGIILRSSAGNENLSHRGKYLSTHLRKNFTKKLIEDELKKIFQHYESTNDNSQFAVLIQPHLGTAYLGDSSNERRFVRTKNYWVWSLKDKPGLLQGFNSWRDPSPDSNKQLRATSANLEKGLKSIARWCNDLNKGRIHIEWAWANGRLWILQIDFEDNQPDDGHDPNDLIRDSDTAPAGKLPKNTFLKEIKIRKTAYGWGKVDIIKEFVKVHGNNYPKLFMIDGATLSAALTNENVLKKEIATITNGRAISRTACNSDIAEIRKHNLPRTFSSTPDKTITFLKKTNKGLQKKGATASEICFVIHKFIPALASAWVCADPASNSVKVDSLWGVPDGLQYYPHDSFEVDIKFRKIVSTKLRYKPFFIQEQKSGDWQKVGVERKSGWSQSLATSDILEIAKKTFQLAKNFDKPIQVMWFCKIPDSLGIGNNLPWFKDDYKPSSLQKFASPKSPKYTIRNIQDIESAKALITKHTLILEPDLELIREDDQFLKKIIELASEKDFPVELKGSSLGHAYYLLADSGVAVYPADEIQYTRQRGRKEFGKLVRDSIPEAIEKHGEKAYTAKIQSAEAKDALIIKLFEEVFELRAAKKKMDVTMELADVLEVLKSFSHSSEIEWNEVEVAAASKRAERGGFETGVILMATSLPTAKGNKNSSKMISLKDLEAHKVTSEGVKVNFPYLLQKNSEVRIRFADGKLIGLKISADGAIFREIIEDDLLEETDQLSLF